MSETRHEDACERTAGIEGMRRSELTPALRAHAASCPHCTRALDAIERVITLGREGDDEPLDPARSERLRARVLESARRAPRPSRIRGPWVTSAIAVGIAALVVLAIGIGRGSREQSAADGAIAATPTPSTPPPSVATEALHGTVRASAGAHFTRVSDGPDEIVRLVEGAITVSVTPLVEGERFRVIVGDAEVEVRGTAFEVSASEDHLDAVHVFHGRVEVRLEDRDPVVLEADERWARPDDATLALREESERAIAEGPETEAPTRRTTPSGVRHESAPTPSVAPPTEGAWTPAASFETGWDALGAGDPAAAAIAFDELLERAPDDALAEDASFWRGVALSRAGRDDEARDALDAFVHAYPHSLRANEASVMLGWLLVDEGRRDAAREMFTRGAHDPVERVRQSAERGLRAVTGSATTTEVPTP